MNHDRSTIKLQLSAGSPNLTDITSANPRGILLPVRGGSDGEGGDGSAVALRPLGALQANSGRKGGFTQPHKRVAELTT